MGYTVWAWMMPQEVLPSLAQARCVDIDMSLISRVMFISMIPHLLAEGLEIDKIPN